jgi:anti-anti-sigma factor
VITVQGALDLASAKHWEAEAAAAAEAGGATVIDLRDVGFIDSAGVHALFRMLRSLDRQGRRLAVVAPRGGRVRRLLEIVDVPALASICETPAEAFRVTSTEPR